MSQIEFKLDRNKAKRLRDSLYEIMSIIDTVRHNDEKDEMIELGEEEKCPGCGKFSLFFNKHHIVPRSLDGLDEDCNIIRICIECHSKIHLRKSMGTSDLIKAGLARAKAAGRVGGRPISLPDKLIGELRDKGLSFSRISKELETLGFKVKPSSVCRSVKRIKERTIKV
jgi:hypothetical protein